jgi:hypothetical protein
MSTRLARVVRGVTDRSSRGVPEPQPEAQADLEATELANASIVAAALGLGIYIETLV